MGDGIYHWTGVVPMDVTIGLKRYFDLNNTLKAMDIRDGRYRSIMYFKWIIPLTQFCQ